MHKKSKNNMLRDPEYPKGVRWVENVGMNLFKSFSFEINGQVISKQNNCSRHGLYDASVFDYCFECAYDDDINWRILKLEEYFTKKVYKDVAGIIKSYTLL